MRDSLVGNGYDSSITFSIYLYKLLTDVEESIGDSPWLFDVRLPLFDDVMALMLSSPNKYSFIVDHSKTDSWTIPKFDHR